MFIRNSLRTIQRKKGKGIGISEYGASISCGAGSTIWNAMTTLTPCPQTTEMKKRGFTKQSHLIHALLNETLNKQASNVYLQLSDEYPYVVAQTVLPPYSRMSIPPVENPILPRTPNSNSEDAKNENPMNMIRSTNADIHAGTAAVAPSDSNRAIVADLLTKAKEMVAILSRLDDSGLSLDSTKRKRTKKMKKHKYKKRLKRERHTTRKTRSQ